MTGRDWTPAVPATRTNPLAIAALACGIVQFGYLLSRGLALAGLAAIVLGHLARNQIRRSGERGHGLAVAGLILGYAGLALALLSLLAILLLSSSGPVGPSH